MVLGGIAGFVGGKPGLAICHFKSSFNSAALFIHLLHPLTYLVGILYVSIPSKIFVFLEIINTKATTINNIHKFSFSFIIYTYIIFL